VVLSVASLALLGGALAYAAPNPPLSEQPVHGGDITGTATLCGAPASAAWVYLSGRSFVAVSDDAGRFELNYVVPGTYSLRFRSASGEDLAVMDDVVVLKNRVTALGAVELPCADVDGDGDGFTASTDCNDANSAVHPAAAEVCLDAVDNNCDGLVDEGCLLGCEVDADCDVDAFCSDASTCELRREDGEPCAINAQCLSRSCQAGTCGAIVF